MDSVFAQIDSLSQNIELNKRTLFNVILESDVYQSSPENIVFYLFGQLLQFDDQQSLSISSTEEQFGVAAIFLQDEFLTTWFQNGIAKACKNVERFLEAIGDCNDKQWINTMDEDLENYFHQLFGKFAKDLNVKANDVSQISSLLSLVVEITLNLSHASNARNFHLKLFILEAYYQLCLSSSVNKLLIARGGIADILAQTLAQASDNVDESESLSSLVYLQSLTKLFLTLAEIGPISFPTAKRVLINLIKLNEYKKTDQAAVTTHKSAMFLQLLHSTLNTLQTMSAAANISATHFSKVNNELENKLLPSDFILFPTGSTIDFNNLKLSQDGFTLQFWVQFSKVTEDLPFLQIINHKNRLFWNLALRDGMLELSMTDENGFKIRRRFTNFSIDFDESMNHSKFYNIVILQKSNPMRNTNDKFKPSRIHLIVDGQFIQSISSPISEPPTDGHDVTIRMGNLSSEEKSFVSVNNLLVINKVQPHQWIILNYFLGFNYYHNYKDLNLINKFLGYRTLSLFELKSKELQLSYDQAIVEEEEYDNGDSPGAMSAYASDSNVGNGLLNKSFGKIQKKIPNSSASFNLNYVLVAENSVLLNFHSKNIVHDKHLDILLVSDEFKPHSYVLNTVFNSINNTDLNTKFLGVINKSHTIVYYHTESENLLNFLNTVDGITIILKLIESINAHSDNEQELKFSVEKLVLLLKILFSAIHQNHVFAREMEEKGGYHILSIILKNKKKLCGLQVLDTILSFVGYDHNYPIESVIVNSVAYKSLIVDFDIWKDADKETFKFLLFQFTVFSQDSKYHEYNVNKIVKMKIIKRFIQSLKSNIFSEDFLPSVSNTLSILIKSNPSTEIFHSMSTYIIYALKVNHKYSSDPNIVPVDNPELQNECGECILELLENIVSNSPTQHIFRKIIKSITIRWILLLMDDASERIVKIALKLLIKMFSMLGPAFYNNFLSNNGFTLLKNLLKKWYNDEELIVVIFAASFGASQLDNLGTNLLDYTQRLSRRSKSLVVSMPEFQYLLFDLMQESLQNEQECDIESYHKYTASTRFALNNITSLRELYKGKKWISSLCCIIHHLEFSKTTLLMPIYRDFKEILSLIVSDLIFTNENYMIIEHCQADSLTKKILTGLIYPEVAKLVKPEIESESANLRKKTVCKNVCKFLLQSADSSSKILWERPDLTILHECFSLFIEKYSNRYEANSTTLKALKRWLGSLTLERMFILVYALTEENRTELKSLVNTILYNQEAFFSKEALDTKKLEIMVIFLLQAAKEHSNHEDYSIIINALRIIFMFRQQDFRKVSSYISAPATDLILDFFESLLVTSDDAILEKLNNDKTLKDLFEKALFDAFEKFEVNFFYISSIQDVLKGIPKKPMMENAEVKSFIVFRTENVNWRSSIISSELAKYYRHFQDQKDNFQFFISNFNKMKLEVQRILFNTKGMVIVDNIEGFDRIRNRIVPKDELNFEDQLLYKIEVPVVEKHKEAEPSLQNSVPEAMDDTLAEQMELLNVNNEIIDDVEDFELIDEAMVFDSAQEDKNRKVLRSLFVGDRINDLWNVSQLLGLEAEEGILILGETHLYLIENYYHCDNDEVVDIDDAPPESRDPYLKLIHGQNKSKKVTKTVKTHNTKSWELEKLTSVSKRQFLLRDVAIEFFFANGSSFLIICRNNRERDNIYNKFSSRARNSNTDSDLLLALKCANYTPANSAANSTNSSFASKLASAITQNLNGFQTITKKWRSGKISNFYYLILLNTIAGRTFNDLTQYPVFPWVIADYTSEELDFNDPKTFRDLSKPMGAQHSKRARQFKERYDAMKNLNDENAKPFYYGTHYSSAMIVTSFLIRLEPYVQSYLLLQGGKFDHADRLFYSVEKAWNSASKDNYADVRELIPEFFFMPEFFRNTNRFQLGQLQTGETINDVILPPWAHNDPKIFVAKQREALESPYVSQHLHQWIDLIFGYKQRGQSAVDSHNVFHHLSYHGAINLDDITDENERRAMTGIIHNFGQTPLQIFSKPHPQRDCVSCPKLQVYRLSDIPKIEKVSKLPIDHIEYTQQWKGRVKLYSTEDNLKIQGASTFASVLVNGRVFESLHCGLITTLALIGERSFMTGSDDGTINVWKFPVRASKFVTFNSSPILSQLKFQEELEYMVTLRAHLAKVVDIKVCRPFNIAVSLDQMGKVCVWDLVRFRFIREIATSNDKTDGEKKATRINVSSTAGMIVIATDFSVALYNINGDYITSEQFKDKITCVSFPRKWQNVGSSFEQMKLKESHEYWRDLQILLVGTAKNVNVYSLEISKSWVLNLIANFKVRNNEGDLLVNGDNISCVEMNLSSVIDDNEVIGIGEIAAGNSGGNLIVWS